MIQPPARYLVLLSYSLCYGFLHISESCLLANTVISRYAWDSQLTCTHVLFSAFQNWSNFTVVTGA